MPFGYGRDGKDPQAKEKWFALHGIKFEPGQKYFLNDRFLATTEDMSDYNVVHRKAEQARMQLLAQISEADVRYSQYGGLCHVHRCGYYWSAEPGSKPGELDRQMYAALKKWGYPLPFEEKEIDKVWRSRDRSMMMDTTRQRWSPRSVRTWNCGSARQERDRGEPARSGGKNWDESQYAVAVVPWDTGDFTTAKTLAVWCMWNSQIKGNFPPAAQRARAAR